jgi:hypothetical protein
MLRIRFISGAVAAGAFALSAAGSSLALPASVTLLNGSFDEPEPGFPIGTPSTTLAMCPIAGAVGRAASRYWTTYGNTALTSINSWLRVTPDGFTANLVATGGGEGGLVQVLGVRQCTITNVNRFGAWLYVIAGQAEIQLGDGGAGGGDVAVTSTHDRWEYLSACGRPDMLNNQVIVYGVGPAVFYVDDASIWYDPTCPTCPHPAHTKGAPLSPSCGSCEAAVCAVKPHCCSTTWDATCVGLTTSLCPTACAPMSRFASLFRSW